MRIDKFLKLSRIIKRRSVAKEACDSGKVLINGSVAKSSSNVKENDEIKVQFGSRCINARVLSIKEHVLKDEANSLYEIIQDDTE